MSGNVTAVVTALTSTTVAAGGSFSFAGRTSNISNQSTGGGSTTRFFLSADAIIDPSDTVLQFQAVPTLGAFSEFAQNYVVNLPANLAPGTWYVGGLADFNNQVGETNEGDNNNNQITLTVTPPVPPNLTVIVTATSSTTVAFGGNFNWTSNTVNIGGGNSPAGSTAAFFLSTDPIITGQDMLLVTHTSQALSAGAGSATGFNTALGSLAPGTYYLGGIADYYGQIVESNEGDNNGNIVTITVTPPPAPDLRAVVTALTNTSMSAGGSFSFGVNTVNEGNAAAAGSTTRVFLSTDTIINGFDTVLAIQAVGAVNSGGGQGNNYLVNMPGNLAPGTYYVGGLADFNSQIGESNEGNNNGNYLTITILPPSMTESGASNLALLDAIASSFVEESCGCRADPLLFGESLSAQLLAPSSAKSDNIVV